MASFPAKESADTTKSASTSETIEESQAVDPFPSRFAWSLGLLALALSIFLVVALHSVATTAHTSFQIKKLGKLLASDRLLEEVRKERVFSEVVGGSSKDFRLLVDATSLVEQNAPLEALRKLRSISSLPPGGIELLRTLSSQFGEFPRGTEERRLAFAREKEEIAERLQVIRGSLRSLLKPWVTDPFPQEDIPTFYTSGVLAQLPAIDGISEGIDSLSSLYSHLSPPEGTWEGNSFPSSFTEELNTLRAQTVNQVAKLRVVESSLAELPAAKLSDIEVLRLSILGRSALISARTFLATHSLLTYTG